MNSFQADKNSCGTLYIKAAPQACGHLSWYLLRLTVILLGVLAFFMVIC